MFTLTNTRLNCMRTALVISSFFVLNSYAQADVYEKYDPCADYAAKAVYQFRSQQMLNCGFADARWNENGAGQHNWCRTVRPKETENETQARAQLLMKCMNPQGSINQNDVNADSASLTAEMHSAANRGATERLQQLIAAGANLEGTQGNLMANALASGQIKTLTFLQNLIPLDIGDSNPLENYICYGSDPKENADGLNKLQWLISHGVDPNKSSKGGQTPLAAAIERNNVLAVNFLIRAGANPNIDVRGNNCSTNMPLDIAIDRGDEKIIAALRKAGAKTQDQCSGG